MRFNPDFFKHEQEPDPDPDLTDKFFKLNTLDDLPDGAKEEFEEMRERVEEMLEHERSVSKRDEIVTYLTFCQFQIHALQSEISNIYKMAIVLAKAIDEK